jgi:hypothetical protein
VLKTALFSCAVPVLRGAGSARGVARLDCGVAQGRPLPRPLDLPPQGRGQREEAGLQARGHPPPGQCTGHILAIYGPMIYTAPYLMLRETSITRASGRGLGPGNQDFFGPCEIASLGECHLGPKK